MPVSFHGKLVTRHWHAFVKRSIVSTRKPVFVYKGTYRFSSNDVRVLRCAISVPCALTQNASVRA